MSSETDSDWLEVYDEAAPSSDRCARYELFPRFTRSRRDRRDGSGINKEGKEERLVVRPQNVRDLPHSMSLESTMVAFVIPSNHRRNYGGIWGRYALRKDGDRFDDYILPRASLALSVRVLASKPTWMCACLHVCANECVFIIAAKHSLAPL